MPTKRYRIYFIACGMMLAVDAVCSLTGAGRWLQMPSGWLAALFLGAGCRVDQDVLLILVNPPLTVSPVCSGSGFFAFLCGMGGAFYGGRSLRRWLVILLLSYVIALLANSARIVMAWHFHRLSGALLPEWLQEYCHMGIGLLCFLSITAVLLWWLAGRGGAESGW